MSNYEQHFDNVSNQKSGSDGWVVGKCPFHEDSKPSFAFRTETGQWICFSGCGKGDIFNYIMKKHNLDFKGAKKLLGEKRPKQTVTAVYKYVDDAGTFRYRKERIEPGRKGKSKEFVFKNKTTGEWKYGRGGSSVLYHLDEIMKSETVYITEGEGKADLLRKWGYTATCLDSGAMSKWSKSHIESVRGRNIIILPDNDEPGKKYADKLVVTLNKVASSIIVVELPGLQHKWDIVDWVRVPGNTKEAFAEIVETSPVYEPKKEEVLHLPSFVDIDLDKHANKYVSCDIVISGETSGSFHAVSSFRISHCERREGGTCSQCSDDISIPNGATEFIGSCMSTDTQVLAMLRLYCCQFGQRPQLEILDKVTIKEFFAHQLAKAGEELVEKRIYIQTNDVLKPGRYKIYGWVKTHPKNQSITFLAERMEPQEEDYAAYIIDADLLSKFSAIEMKDILHDIANNITKIYKRDEMLLTVLLTFFSPLRFNFNESEIRGWLCTALIGDSGVGKTQTYKNLSAYTGIGERFPCISGTRTGLTYALDKHPLRGWQCKVGKYPANTRKLLMLDEVQHLDTTGLMTMSIAMDEGFLQVERVASKGYESMTRLIMLCNPKSGAVLDNFMFGCQVLSPIFPPEMIRRLDLVVFANAGDIKDLTIINSAVNSSTPEISREMLRNAIYFVWKLKPNDIAFKATSHCLTAAQSIIDEFGSAIDMQLVAKGDFRNTLARIATAFACLDMNMNKHQNGINVLKYHVDMAEKLIRAIYGAESCQLNEYSEIKRLQNEIPDYNKISSAFIAKWKGEKLDRNFSRTVGAFRLSDYIRVNDIIESLDCHSATAKRTIAFLKSHNLIKTNRKNGYEKLPRFVKFLRRFLSENPAFLLFDEGGSDGQGVLL